MPFFTSPTVSVAQLLRPFPEMTSLTATNLNQRKFRDHSLDMTLQRRFPGGFSLNFALSLNRAAGLVDGPQRIRYGADAVVHQQQCAAVAGHGHRAVSVAVRQGADLLEERYSGQSPGAGNLAARLNCSPDRCSPGRTCSSPATSSDIKNGKKIPSEWFNINAGFQRTPSLAPGTYQARVFPPFIDGLRGDWTTS